MKPTPGLPKSMSSLLVVGRMVATTMGSATPHGQAAHDEGHEEHSVGEAHDQGHEGPAAKGGV